MSGTTAAQGAAAPTGSWEELVTTALLGTERRALPAPPVGSGVPLLDTAALVDRSDPAFALLDLAAVSTVHRRAGLCPAPAAELPAPAPQDPRPSLPPAARRRLAMLLTDRAGLGATSRGTAPNLAELLPQWLAAARRHGYRAPAALLPALLDASRSRSDLRPDALALAGPRGTWLAAFNPDWKFALRAVPATTAAVRTGSGAASRDEAAPAGAADSAETTGHTGKADGTAAPTAGGHDGTIAGTATAGERRQWEEGLFAERVAMLSRLRRRAPAAAVALLRTTWATERAEERALFLETLRENLSAQDEPFLEEALSDRSKNVRAVAAELLSALPGSALASRMAERARACVALESRDGSYRLVITAPVECDAAMQRDGVIPKPPTGRGERAWWLGQLVEAAPLDVWTAAFGLSPAQIVSLPVADEWHGDLHAAWGRAAVRQRDAAWARALLGVPTIRRKGEASGPFTATAAGTTSDPARLLSALPEGDRALWVAGFIGAHGLSDALPMLAMCSVPWPVPLGRAVIDSLDIARDAGNYPWSYSGVMGLAERCLDPAQADRVDALTAIPEKDGFPGSGAYWSEAFQRLASTLRLRATMLAELAEGTV